MSGVDQMSEQLGSVANWIEEIGHATGSKRMRRGSRRFSRKLTTFADRSVDVADALTGKRPRRRRGLAARAAGVRERIGDVADAARNGGRHPNSGDARWLILPVAGLAVYASAKGGVFSRAPKAVQDAAERAAELPQDVLATVRSQPSSPRAKTPRTKPTNRATSAKRTAKKRAGSARKSTTTGAKRTSRSKNARTQR